LVQDLANHADALDTAAVDYDEVVSRIQFHSQQIMQIMMQIQEHCQQPATADESVHDCLEDLTNCAKKFDVKAGILSSYKERIRRGVSELRVAFETWKNSLFLLLISVIGVL